MSVMLANCCLWFKPCICLQSPSLYMDWARGKSLRTSGFSPLTSLWPLINVINSLSQRLPDGSWRKLQRMLVRWGILQEKMLRLFVKAKTHTQAWNSAPGGSEPLSKLLFFFAFFVVVVTSWYLSFKRKCTSSIKEKRGRVNASFG